MRIIGLEAGSGVGRQLGRMLQEENAAVALVADRDLSGSGLEVEMFGRTRRIPLGPAALALRTGAPLLPAGLYTLPGGWGVVICPPIEYEPVGDRRADVEALTRALAREFETRISAAPADWHLFEPGWPA
jgi:KDO2-lipid IV(A) lauroyltransferase